MSAWCFEHPFLTFILLFLTIEVLLLLANRILRTIKVLCRGWPPSHLDADGDWRKKNEDFSNF